MSDWFEVAQERVTDAKTVVNYGLNKVRFPAPVLVGSRVRLSATLADVTTVAGGLQLTVAGVIEREGSDKPVCVLESVSTGDSVSPRPGSLTSCLITRGSATGPRKKSRRSPLSSPTRPT